MSPRISVSLVIALRNILGKLLFFFQYCVQLLIFLGLAVLQNIFVISAEEYPNSFQYICLLLQVAVLLCPIHPRCHAHRSSMWEEESTSGILLHYERMQKQSYHLWTGCLEAIYAKFLQISSFLATLDSLVSIFRSLRCYLWHWLHLPQTINWFLFGLRPQCLCNVPESLTR